MANEQEKRVTVEQGVILPIDSQVFYTNRIAVGTSESDVQLQAHINNRLNCTIAMPYPTAQALVRLLSLALKEYERKTESKILDLNEIGALMKKNS